MPKGLSRPVKKVPKEPAKPRPTKTKAKPAKKAKPRKSDRVTAIAMAEAVRSVIEKVNTGQGGRPTDYMPEYAVMVEKLCQLNVGVTDKDVADFFDVCEATVNNWKHSHPEFLESMRMGKKVSDVEVANALFRRATGARWIEEKEVKRKEIEYDKKTGKKIREEEFIEVVPLIKEAPPDATAGRYWLNNRQPERWKERTEAQAPPPPISPTDALTLGFARKLAFMLEKAARIQEMKTVSTTGETVTE